MKKIAVTQRLIKNESYDEVREALDIHYCKLISSCGFLPVVLPYEVAFEEYFNEFEIDGVLLTGGNDLSICGINELSKRRDDFEKKLLKHCIEYGIPVFGICRGMQLIADYFKSSFKEVDNQVNTRHTLVVNQDSKYCTYLNKLESVNSYHNFAVGKMSDELLISATSENGIIKAIEHKKYRIFGQMWHSEREKEFKKNEVAIIKDFFNFGLDEVINIAKRAGDEIMNIYSQNFETEYKEDQFPITQADVRANEVIIKGLKSISIYPILTEESPVEYSIRKNWKRFWLVDPLDGTKDFIAKNGEFTVNIALIENNKPILGVVYVPVNGDVYNALKGGGAFKNGKKIFNKSCRKELVGSDSNFHSTDKIKEFFKVNGIKNIQRYGSSIKICKLSEGEIDVYPRFNGTKEWDTAASHIIANESGCKLVDIKTKKELVYNKKIITNNHFLACRNDLEFDI